VQKYTAMLPKMCFPELGKKSKNRKKRKNNPVEHYISPLCPAGPVKPICTIFDR